ncbi:mitochondrial ribosome-associated GTPase 2 isoform X3 [Anabrus simplex]|uniref:mitochondrial ribosome-associated GTPase 2 isoform X3 n=1 Tax=Anabrus simplex TaxID=316456 RepID=UPI0034DDC38D
MGVKTYITWKVKKHFKSERTPVALRSKKEKSRRIDTLKHFVDQQHVRVIGGKGGDGAISFLQLWCNAEAGPDGGDGGNGGHVIFQASNTINNLNHLSAIVQADSGEKGYNKDCSGRNAQHTVVKVPTGTIVKSEAGKVIADLKQEGMMFVAARGGAGGHGNHFFVSDTEQAPQVAEYGAEGESFQYTLEVRSMAHVGLIGFPNAGKSTLLQAISRARPKIAPYPFTTLKPYLGIINYDDYEQIAVADLPGLIPGSHKNRGLGITFLKHAERCSVLVIIVDLSSDEPWKQVETLRYELNQFSPELAQRPQIIVANKLDLPEAEENLPLFRNHVNQPVLAISAKVGTNLTQLLQLIREMYDEMLDESRDETLGDNHV